MKKLFLLIVCLAACVAAYAQDIIVLADGSAIQAKVEKITPTEIEYKKAINPTGPTYTVSIKDVVSVTYENGTRDVFNQATTETAPQVNTNTAYRTQETASGFSSDNELRAMYYGRDFEGLKKKAKTWKIAGLSAGSACIVGGGTLLLWLICTQDFNSGGEVAGLIGAIALTGGGIATIPLCLAQSSKYNKLANQVYQSMSIWNQDFRLDNGNTLSLGVDAMRVGGDCRNMGLGFGIRYNF